MNTGSIDQRWFFRVDSNAIANLPTAEQEEAYKTLLPLQDYAVQRFVNWFGTNENESQRILVGPKGSGKTLWLEAKSYAARRREAADRHRYPRSALYERISGRLALKDAISERPTSWKSVDMWRDAWTLALQLVAFDCAKLRTTLSDADGESLARLFPGPQAERDGNLEEVSASEYLVVVVRLFNDKAWREQATTVQSKILERRLRNYAPPIDLYLDAPDEAVSSSAVSSNTEEEVTCRLELQAGLLFAIREVENIKFNLNVYATLRAEVYGAARKMELFQQARTRCLPLIYEARQLESIFAKNCEAANEALVGKSATSKILKFFEDEKNMQTTNDI